MESDTLCNTLSDVEAKALLDMVADTVAAVKKEKYGKTLVDVKAKALVDTLADTPAQLEAKTVGETH